MELTFANIEYQTTSQSEALKSKEVIILTFVYKS